MSSKTDGTRGRLQSAVGSLYNISVLSVSLLFPLVVACSPPEEPGPFELLSGIGHASNADLWALVRPPAYVEEPPMLVSRESGHTVETRYVEHIETALDRRFQLQGDGELWRLSPAERMRPGERYDVIDSRGTIDGSLRIGEPLGFEERPRTPSIYEFRRSRWMRFPCFGEEVDSYELSLSSSLEVALNLVQTKESEVLAFSPGEAVRFIREKDECLELQVVAVGHNGLRSVPSSPINTCEVGCGCSAAGGQAGAGASWMGWLLLGTALLGLRQRL